MIETPAFESLWCASTSPARRALIATLGLPFGFEAPGVEEDVPSGTAIEDTVKMLARRKAQAVFQRHPEGLVVGADQLVAFEGAALGKPKDRDAARAQLRRLSGRTHQIVTGVCVLARGFERVWAEVTRMTLYPLSDDEVERYLDSGEWEGCAGAYRVESQGQALFCEIAGDRTNVQGLPMVSLVAALREAGVRFFR